MSANGTKRTSVCVASMSALEVKRASARWVCSGGEGSGRRLRQPESFIELEADLGVRSPGSAASTPLTIDINIEV